MKDYDERIMNLRNRTDVLWLENDNCLGLGVRMILDQAEDMSSAWDYSAKNALISVIEEYLYLLEQAQKEDK